MARPRVIPCLLLQGPALVKTVGFSRPRYIGDPINAVKLFNDLEVDELMLLDINATRENREPHYDRIREIVSEAFMPVAYGGGVRGSRQAETLLQSGVEKVVITTEAAIRPQVLGDVARAIGSQSVVAGIDVYRNWFGRCTANVRNGSRAISLNPVEHAAACVQEGAGEILVHSVDRDGRMAGYDIAIVRLVCDTVNVPVVACGGAGSLQDIRLAIDAGASAAAAGSLFVFKGARRGVLINYPSPAELSALIGTTS